MLTGLSNARVGFLDQRVGDDLPSGWLDRFLEVVGDRDTLAGGTRLPGSPEPRLVLFAETADSRWLAGEGTARLRALARRLPEAVAVVISALGNVPLTRIVDPGFAYLAVDAPGLPGRQLADYVEVPLTGDQVAETDELGRSGYATALATLVLLPGTGPMTIGIHAPWGMGKSSFMRFVERDLTAHRARAAAGLAARTDYGAAPRLERELDLHHGAGRGTSLGRVTGRSRAGGGPGCGGGSVRR